MSEGLFDQFAPAIAALPSRTPLSRADLLSPTFVLHEELAFSLYYAPFDYINIGARVVLVGITPGWYQTEMAFRLARDVLQAGGSHIEACRAAREHASFSGPIRTTLVAMLDGIGINTALGINTCWQLYGDRADLLHTTAAIRYPVFVRGQNYAGYTPNMLKTPLLRCYVTDVLGDELRRIPDALIVAVGRSIGDALRLLANEGIVAAERCVIGLPHPSGANVHRPAQYARVRDTLAEQVRRLLG